MEEKKRVRALSIVEEISNESCVSPFINVCYFEDGSAAPCTPEGTAIEPDEWYHLLSMIDKFYSNNGSTEYISYGEWHRAKHTEKRTVVKKETRAGWVYILQAGPYFKIGYSKNVDKRIERLATLPPFDMELIHTIRTDNMDTLEKYLHERFDDKRKNGEWFELDEEDIAWLKTL